MSDFIRICAQSELPQPGNVKEFTANGRALCVANLDGAISVLNGVCPHEEGPLGEGTIENGCVICPWHGYAFNLRTGEATDDPALKAEVYESKLENGELRAKL
jgi:nitrite reductase/ring-hydroxylating ferredoxin subunit